jgi:hypothetical protein
VNSVINALRIASVNTFEDWGMMLVDEQTTPSTASFINEEDLFVAWVDLRGVVCGRLSVVAQQPFLEALCCNVVGDSPEAFANHDHLDAFRELSNIITGSFLTAAFGHSETFDLYASHVELTSVTKLERAVRPETNILFIADESPVLVGIELNEERAHD